MKSILFQTIFHIRYSYWFIPSLMALGAVALAAALIYLDIYYLAEIPPSYEWLFRSQPSGARALLSTVAGSTITVAGVVFSMTIMSVSHATSNYGSRLLLKFLSDRRNQIALGTFIATFIYCLLILRTVSSADDGGQYTDFVPHLAVLGGLGLALASVAVLIAFIHHVPDTIHIADVAANRGGELLHRLDQMFPDSDIDGCAVFDHQAIEIDDKLFCTVTAGKSGYIQTLDVAGLLAFCTERDLQALVAKPLGDFVYENEQIMRVRANGSALEDPSALSSFFAIGSKRTPDQDIRFLIEELSQIAIRALSPGVNDPFTAITCIDWLGNAVAHVVDRPIRNPHLRDDEKVLRLIMPCYGFAELSQQIFSRLTPYVVEDLSVSLHMAKVLSNILSFTTRAERALLIRNQAQTYLSKSIAIHDNSADTQRLESAYAAAL